MKHCDIERDQKFRRRVSLLHNIIAMPVSNDYQPTLSQMREQDRQLLKRQSMENERKIEPIQKGLMIRLLRKLRSIRSRILGKPTKVIESVNQSI